MKTFESLGIKISKTGGTQQKTLCPNCSVKRKKKDEPCLSVNTETGQYKCHNCGFCGGIKTKGTVKETYSKRTFTKPSYNPDEWGLTKEVIDYFKKRGISKLTLEINRVGAGYGKLTSRAEEETDLIAFPFIKNNQIVNVKWRTPEKDFKSAKNAEQCFYGIQNLFDDGYLATDKIYITEGEIDALSLYEAGFKYALSVPSGAQTEEEGSHKVIPKLEFLEDPDIQTIFSSVSEFILVTDSDYKGRRLRDELANRIGLERCFYAEYPADCKDANDVLVNYGADTLAECLINVKPMLKGLVEVTDLEDNLLTYYKSGLSEGLKTGIEPFDKIYTLQESLVTLVTGTPESFKSVSLDNITQAYALENDLHIAMFSPESKPLEFHIGRLASIYNGKSLDPENSLYMTYSEFVDAYKWINKHYSFLQPNTSTIQEVLALAKISILKHGTKILVIDPYSRLKVEGDIEAGFIQNMLNEVAEFAVRYKVHVFIVAHPVKMEAIRTRGTSRVMSNYPLVTPYHIKGSSNWYNSADFILSLWKDRTDVTAPIEIHCLKSKFHNIAKSSEFCQLQYNFDNWRLEEIN